MNYKINFHYKDDKHLALLLPESEVQSLFESLNNSEVYLNKISNAGFWTDIRDIRYITSEEVKDEQPKGSIKPLQDGNGDPKGRKEASSKA